MERKKIQRIVNGSRRDIIASRVDSSLWKMKKKTSQLKLQVKEQFFSHTPLLDFFFKVPLTCKSLMLQLLARLVKILAHPFPSRQRYKCQVKYIIETENPLMVTCENIGLQTKLDLLQNHE